MNTLHTARTQATRPSAFTLLELLVVMAIIAILVTAATMGTARSVTDLQLTTASAEVSALFKRAREEAMLKNQRVELRLYQHPLETSTGSSFSELTIGIDDGAGAFEPIAPSLKLDEKIMIVEAPPYSTMIDFSQLSLASSDLAPTTGNEILPSNTTAVPYVGIRFAPEGRVLLHALSSGDPWTLTVGLRHGETYSSTPLPINFATIELSPATGHINLVRP